MRPNRIHANQINFNPRRSGGRTKRFDAVTGTSVSANDSFLFRLREHIHHSAITGGPVLFGETVHEADVDVIGLQLPSKAVEIVARSLRIASPRFCHHRDLIARALPDCFGDVRMAAVCIRCIEEAQAMVVAVEQQIGETFNAD